MSHRNLVYVLSVLGTVIATGCADSPSGSPTPRPIRVTGIPDENPTELARRFAPLVSYLERELGGPVTYTPVTDYAGAVQALAAGHTDFAWLGGFTHVQARRMAKVRPLAMRAADREFRSVFIAHRDSGIERPEQLRGKTFAFGSKSSTSGHLMPRHFLQETFGLRPEGDFQGAPIFSGAHDATARFVASGRVHAGALNKLVWDRLIGQGQIDPATVRVIWVTPPYVDYVWTARGNQDPVRIERFKNAFLKLDPTRAEDRAVLDLQGAQKFVPASPEDFDVIETIARKTGLIGEGT